MIALPPLYAIVDLDTREQTLHRAEVLLEAGVRLIQLRAKGRTAAETHAAAQDVAPLCRAHGALFAVNDRADIAAAVKADILHLGQNDLSPGDARSVFGGAIGLSTHTLAQVEAAQAEPVDYLGFGPVFPTRSKANPDPVTGVEMLAAAAAASRLPVVAIGGISGETASAVLGAGARSVAVISALIGEDDGQTRLRARTLLALKQPAG